MLCMQADPNENSRVACNWSEWYIWLQKYVDNNTKTKRRYNNTTKQQKKQKEIICVRDGKHSLFKNFGTALVSYLHQVM